MKHVTIHISPQGEVKVEVDGLTGPCCLLLSREIEQALGRVDSRVDKPAMHQPQTQNHAQHASNSHQR
jgi:hypothetical protein